MLPHFLENRLTNGALVVSHTPLCPLPSESLLVIVRVIVWLGGLDHMETVVTEERGMQWKKHRRNLEKEVDENEEENIRRKKELKERWSEGRSSQLLTRATACRVFLLISSNSSRMCLFSASIVRGQLVHSAGFKLLHKKKSYRGEVQRCRWPWRWCAAINPFS
jgi:hypothetical protein